MAWLLRKMSKLPQNVISLHTLWSQCDLYLNDTLVTQSSKICSYLFYLKTLLSFGKDAKNSQFSSVLWYQNSSGTFDTRGANNAGYVKRKAIAAQSHEFNLMGRLHLDMGFRYRYILNGIEIKYKLIRAKNSFFCTETPTKPKTKSH